MPCYDERSEGSYIIKHEYEPGIRRLQRRNDKLARMLCYACGLMEENGMLVDDRTKSIKRAKMIELIGWWEGHKEFDNTRKTKKSKRE